MCCSCGGEEESRRSRSFFHTSIKPFPIHPATLNGSRRACLSLLGGRRLSSSMFTPESTSSKLSTFSITHKVTSFGKCIGPKTARECNFVDYQRGGVGALVRFLLNLEYYKFNCFSLTAFISSPVFHCYFLVHR